MSNSVAMFYNVLSEVRYNVLMETFGADLCVELFDKVYEEFGEEFYADQVSSEYIEGVLDGMLLVLVPVDDVCDDCRESYTTSKSIEQLVQEELDRTWGDGSDLIFEYVDGISEFFTAILPDDREFQIEARFTSESGFFMNYHKL